MAHQTLLYEVATGKILKIEPNLYISKGIHKEKFCPGYKHPQIGVFYLEGREVLDPETISVKPAGAWGMRMVVDKYDTPINLLRIMQKYDQLCGEAFSIRFQCEGGLGDHLMQAAACLAYKKMFPIKWIGLSVKKDYEEVLKRVEGLDLIAASILDRSCPKGTLTISGAVEYMADPRGIGYGKQSLYGTRLGLGRVDHLARIYPDPADIDAGAEYLKFFHRDPKRPLIGLHFNSASGVAKNWPLFRVMDFAKTIYSETKYELVVFGRNWEYPKDDTLGINLTGEPDWLKVYQVILNCDYIVCIDSGILHLVRALRQPYTCLWGGSSPVYINGEALRLQDIQLDLDCKDKLCMQCPKGKAACMSGITAGMVLEKISSGRKTKTERSKKSHGQRRAKGLVLPAPGAGHDRP